MASIRVGLLALVAILLAPATWGQTSTGSLRGQVKDPSAAVIPGVTVTTTGRGNTVRVATTNQQGSYVMNGLAPGSYTVRIMAKGFAAFETSVEIRGGATQTLDASLIV